jgi:valyl-tRNA synthetase
MPFVTEEIWQTIRAYLPEGAESIMISPYPVALPRDHGAEEEISHVMEAVTCIRNIRGELNISPGAEVNARIKTFRDGVGEILEKNLPLIQKLAKAREITIGKDVDKPKGSATGVRASFELYVPLEGVLNIKEEVARMMKEKTKVLESLTYLNKKLTSEDFLARAPKDVVQKEKARYQELVLKDERLEGTIKRLNQMGEEHD